MKVFFSQYNDFIKLLKRLFLRQYRKVSEKNFDLGTREQKHEILCNLFCIKFFFDVLQFSLNLFHFLHYILNGMRKAQLHREPSKFVFFALSLGIAIKIFMAGKWIDWVHEIEREMEVIITYGGERVKWKNVCVRLL